MSLVLVWGFVVYLNNKCRSSAKDVKVIPGKEIVSQHCLLMMEMVFKKKIRRKIKYGMKLKLWRSRESEVREEFAEGLTTNLMVWFGKKELDVLSEVWLY